MKIIVQLDDDKVYPILQCPLQSDRAGCQAIKNSPVNFCPDYYDYETGIYRVHFPENCPLHDGPIIIEKKGMNIKAWDNGGATADRFTIRIHNDFYSMDDNPGMPNGICIYLGEFTAENYTGQGVKIEQKDLPEGVQKKIAELS